MFDKNFDEPNYDVGYGSDLGDDNYSDKPKIDIKKFMPLIIIAIIGIIIVAFIMVYFGSQQEVTINIEEYGGGTLSVSPTLTLYSNNEIIYGPKSGELHKVTLANGTYDYAVISSDYKTDRGTITIGPENKSIDISLEKDIQAELSINASFDKIYAGQTLNGSIHITEVETGISNAKIVVTDSEKLLTITPTQSTINISEGGVLFVDFSVSVSETITTSIDTTINISIGGTRIKDTLKITVNPTVKPASITITGSLNKTDLTAGQFLTPTTLKIKNNDKKIDLEDVTIEIIPDAASQDKLNWFEFLNYQDVAYKYSISKILKNSEEIVSLKVNVPITAEIGDEFTGKLVISSNSLESKKEQTMIYRVKSKPTVSLKLTKTVLSAICPAGDCPEIDLGIEKVQLENNGSATVNNVVVTIDPNNLDPECTYWFEPSTYTISTIDPKEKVTLNMKIWPITITETTKRTCYFLWAYDDPTTGSRETGRSDPPMVVTITYKD